MIWEKLLTDNDGQYVELQSGRLFNQAAEGSMYSPFKHVSFMPYTHDSWTEYWFPVKNTRGLTHATPEIALNLRVQNGWLKWDACAISPLNDTLTMSVPFTRDVPVKRMLQLKPLETVRDSIRWSGEVERLKIQLGETVIANGQPADLTRPLAAPKEFDWESEYGLYTQAKDLANQRKYEEAATYLKKVIEKNKYHVDALVDLGELYLNFKIGWQGHALPLIKQALAINAYHPKANYLQGMMEWNMVGSLDYFGVASLHSAYRSPALTQLAIRAIRNEEWAKADEFLQQALEANSTNFDALQLEIVVARKRKRNAHALKLIKELLFKDPLNHFARFENTLITNGEDNKKAFSGLINSELPHETYIEIALWYNKLRLFEEGLQVLEYAPKEVMVLLWKSELMSQLSKDGKQYQMEALKMSPERVFPFRDGDSGLFLNALSSSDKNAAEMGSYYFFLAALALKQVDAKHILRVGEPEIKYAPYYLLKAELLKDEKEEVLNALEKAYEIDPKSWRVVKRLAEFYAANGELKKAIRINEEKLTKYLKTKKVETSGLPEHEIYILGQQRAELLKQAGRYQEALEVLNSLTILPNEGASGAHKLYRELNIRYAATLNQQKKYREAFAVLEQAEKWPENLGSGEPYNPDNRLTWYLKKWMTQKLTKQEPQPADITKLTKNLSAYEFELLKLFQ
ncbi:MAG TPA: hypothetical protein DCM71_18485 [Runella sp.]|nr:hypothetical protein [Runella sp.]